MKPFKTLKSKVMPLDRANVDTDAIMPKQFLASVEKTGYKDFVFDEWRYLDKGYLGIDTSRRKVNPEFCFNKEQFRGVNILLTRENFGCGSSREHAVWGLYEYGIRCIIAPSFADIFYNNSIKNGLLPITLEDNIVDNLFSEVKKGDLVLSINLVDQTLSSSTDTFIFEIAPDAKQRLLNGLDDIELTLKDKELIKQYEEERKVYEPWIFS